MPTPPLPDHIADQLRGDPTSALAALFVIANVHREMFSWVARTICGENGAVRPRPRKSNGAAHKSTPRCAGREGADRRLLEAMGLSPGATIGELAAAIERSRTTAVTTLHRLRDAGLVESVEGKWRLTEPEAPMAPPERWTKPIRGDVRAAHAHLTAAS
jgi:DNA-binding transcriptional ArsR family regulator